MIKLSIIIPHFNSPSMLEKLICTIPINEQIQVIVVDDNSDMGKNLYEDIKEKYNHITFMENKTNKKGAGICRNIGLKIAKGEWLLFADADDYFTKNFYDEVTKWFDTKSDLVFFPPTSQEIDSGKISDRHIQLVNLINKYSIERDRESELFLKYRFVVPWSKLIKRKIVVENDIKFSETIVANDVIFSTNLAMVVKEISISDQEIYCVTRSKGSLTTLVKKDILNVRLNIFIENYNILKSSLNKYEMKILDIKGTSIFMNSILYKTGFKNIILTYFSLARAQIPVFSPFIKKFIKQPCKLLVRIKEVMNSRRKLGEFIEK